MKRKFVLLLSLLLPFVFCATVVGYGYYASLQPNWAQTGENKTIRIQFKVY